MTPLLAVNARKCCLPSVALAIALAGFVTVAMAQTADELIAKNLDAKGGLAQIMAIKSRCV